MNREPTAQSARTAAGIPHLEAGGGCHLVPVLADRLAGCAGTGRRRSVYLGRPGSSDAWSAVVAVIVGLCRGAAAVLQVEGGRDQDDSRRERRPGVDGVAAGNRLVN